MLKDPLYADPAILYFRRGWLAGQCTKQTPAVSLVAALAGTSAFFGPLADETVHRHLRRRLLWLWLYPKPHKSLAPPIGRKRMIDGCLWDTHALGTALQLRQRLGIPSTRLLVVASYPVDVQTWWRPRTGAYDPLRFEEDAYFEGACDPRVLYKSGRCTLLFVEACVVSKRSSGRWTFDRSTVDLYVIIMDGSHLNTIVYHATPKYALHEFEATFHFHRAFAQIDPEQNWIVAFSGGGTRAALTTHSALRILVRNKVNVRALSACSGGAWGIVVHARTGDRAGLASMTRHASDLDRASLRTRLTMAIVHDMIGARGETFMLTASALRTVHFDWTLFVRRLLFGDETPWSWSELLERLPPSIEMIAMPIGVLKAV